MFPAFLEHCQDTDIALLAECFVQPAKKYEPYDRNGRLNHSATRFQAGSDLPPCDTTHKRNPFDTTHQPPRLKRRRFDGEVMR